MNDPLQELLKRGALANSRFSPTSRYYGIETATRETPDGRTAAYVRRRFVPPGERFTLLQEHEVKEGERPDSVAAQYLGDPEQFWRICDANEAMRPDELTEEPGRRVRITLPQELTGSEDA